MIIMGKMLNEFKEFALKGNVVDMAIGVVIGGAFGNIVTSVVNDIFMPLVSVLTGGIDFSNWFVSLNGEKYATLAAAQEAGAATLNFGVLISTIINFVIIAFCLFAVVKAMNKLKKPAPVEEAPAPRLCPYCKSEIAEDATRCPHCTSQL
jgi:large conductance mechanosensitive channel